MSKERIENLVDSYFKENELSEFYFIDCIISNEKKIEVFVDKDGGINFRECQKLSRYLEGIFDETQVYGESYILEVSSPGVGSPLKKVRQYKNNIGRTIAVKTVEQKYLGTLVEVDETGIFVQYEIKVKVGPKKKKKEIMKENILFNDILEAKIKVSFK